MKTFFATLALILLLMAPAAQSGGAFSIDWYSIDSGGVMRSIGGDWELSGTIGQPDASQANEHIGGEWSLTGGFWALIATVLDRLFADRFEQP